MMLNVELLCERQTTQYRISDTTFCASLLVENVLKSLPKHLYATLLLFMAHIKRLLTQCEVRKAFKATKMMYNNGGRNC